jgi:hypothetical protein
MMHGGFLGIDDFCEKRENCQSKGNILEARW